MASPNARFYSKRSVRMELLAWVLLGAGFALTALWAFVGTAGIDSVPVHWGWNGEADRWGSPYEHLLIYGILGFVFAIVSGIGHFMHPDLWNMPSKVTPETKPEWIRLSVKVLVATELELGVLAIVLSLLTITGALISFPLAVPVLSGVVITAMALTLVWAYISWHRYRKAHQ